MPAPFAKHVAAALSILMLSSSVSIAADLTSDEPAYKKPFSVFKNAFDKEASACDDRKITKSIQKGFQNQAKEELGDDGLEIVSISGSYQNRAYDTSETRQIARRFCGATAHFNDGQNRTIWYIIESRMGFASIGDGVTYCVSGFDAWYVHNGACRVER